ncbi:MAG: hypothetical protein UY96_C0001G0046 [Parcubacteria group bacterium GW2011_GWB1_56_8]|nr:MAG: hypothetical protein UY96_C0001G0046 [Parcubacteria group bacterium GW2011_GWB1_56_8]
MKNRVTTRPFKGPRGGDPYVNKYCERTPWGRTSYVPLTMHEVTAVRRAAQALRERRPTKKRE